MTGPELTTPATAAQEAPTASGRLSWADLINPPRIKTTAEQAAAVRAWLGRFDKQPKPTAPGTPLELPAVAAGVTRYAATALAREVEAVAGAVKGHRNDTLNAAAFSLASLIAAGALDYASTRDALLQAAMSTGLSRVESLRTINSGFRAGYKNPRNLAGVREFSEPDVVEVAPGELVTIGEHVDDAGQVWETFTGSTEPEAPPFRSSWAAADLDDVLEGRVEPVRPSLMPIGDRLCLLYRGLIHSMHGESESGKSLILQIEAVRILSGGGRVLFIDFESDLVSVVGRLREFGAGADAIRAGFAYLRPEVRPDTDPRDWAAWAALLGQPFDLAIIDGVTDSLGLYGFDLKDNGEVADWLRQLPRRVAEHTGAAVVLVDHVTKSTDGRGRHAIGAQAKLSGLDGAAYTVEVKRPLGRGLRGVIVLRIGKDRPGFVRAHGGPMRSDRTQEVARVTVDSTGAAPVVTFDPWEDSGDPESGAERPATGWRPTGIMQAISRALERNIGPLSKNQIETHEDVFGGATNRRRALACLEAEGFVRVTDGPNRSKLCESLKPYREADDPESGAYRPRDEPTTQGEPETTPGGFVCSSRPKNGDETNEPNTPPGSSETNRSRTETNRDEHEDGGQP